MIALIIGLAGAVALLLWSIRLVRTGIERGFAGPLRIGVRRASEQLPTAAAGGIVAALAMQSSTAVAMLVAGFAATGSLPVVSSLAVVLGADVGSALAARILLSPVTALTPVLFVLGAVCFFKGRSQRIRQFGRIVIGIGLVLTSLVMIKTATAPLQGSGGADIVAAYLGRDMASSFVLGAGLALATSSSVATVLLVVTMASAGFLPAPAALALVLGANFGGSMIPVILTLSAPRTARRAMLGNLLLRGGGALGGLGFLILWDGTYTALGSTAATQAVNAHVLFNVLLLCIGLPLARPAIRLARAVLPDSAPSGPQRPSALDRDAIGDPDRALGCAAREVLEMGEQVHAMLTPALGLFRSWDDTIANHIRDCEVDVDRMHFDVKLYIARLHEEGPTKRQARRSMDIATIANNLEDAGDQVSSNLVGMARRMHEEGLRFSDEGWRDLSDFHDRVLSNAQLALNVLMSGDADAAIQLVEEKDRARDAETRLQTRHLARLRSGIAASIETSNLHQETIRALKQINTAFSSVGYPIARETGALLSSRLSPDATEPT
ncbi:Na/Pi cotransporter family protein [Oceaniglobus indicus]|uniref:Na/Pi cotransporter family protein n=1 Tax=Oceaniglobus indicus TaxID=2047749 RepID=UPI000C1782F4|nr:Na/Pi cotransporter family protein [Oceaniglobus indicus]